MLRYLWLLLYIAAPPKVLAPLIDKSFSAKAPPTERKKKFTA